MAAFLRNSSGEGLVSGHRRPAAVKARDSLPMLRDSYNQRKL